jgi:hypothetical protein
MDQRSVYLGQTGRAGENRLIATRPPHSYWLRGIAANLARLPGRRGGFFVSPGLSNRPQFLHRA